MVKISDELKIRITPELDEANTNFQNQIKNLLSGANAPKIDRLTVTKIDGAAAISQFKKDIEASLSTISIPKGTLSGSKSSINASPAKEQIRQLDAESRKLEAQNNRLLASYNKLFTSGSLDTKLKGLERSTKLFSDDDAKKAEAQINVVRNLYDQLQAKYGPAGKDILNLDASGAKELERELKSINLEVQKTESFVRSGRGLSSELSKAAIQGNRLQKIINETNNLLRLNDRAKGTSQYKNIENAVAEVEKLKALTDKGIVVDPAQIDRLSSSIKVADAEIVKMGKDGETYGTKLSNQMEKLGVYFSASAIIMGAWNQAKEMVQNVIALDKAVTDLQIATGYTRDETKELLNTYNQMGKELGASTIDVAQSADTWLRQGYAVDETNTLIRNSMVLSKLGQIDSDEATKALTSSMKGYNVSVEDSIGIVDKFTAVDREAAVSAGYIATALAETATGARLAGVDINKVTGYIASIGEVTQDGAESVGNFLKTLFARMGNIKSGELIDPTTSESLSDVETVLSGLGIKLRTSGGEFRNFGEVLDEVAGKWDSYGSVNQRAIAVAFSGTRQQEKFLSLMEHYGDAADYAAVATNSAGTALDKYNNSYLSSVEASQEKFTAQFEQLSNTIWNSDLIKGTFDTGAGLLGALTWLTEKLGTLPTLAGAAGAAFSVFANKGIFTLSDNPNNTSGKKLNLFGSSFADIRKNGLSGEFGRLDVEVLEKYNKALLDGEDSQSAYHTALLQTDGSLKKCTKATEAAMNANAELVRTNGKGAETQEALAQSLNKTGIASKAAAIGMNVLNAAMNMLASMAIAAAINFVVDGILKIANASQEASQKAQEATKEYDEILSSLDSYKSKVKSLQDALASGTLSFDESKQKRLELMQIQDELINQFGTEASTIDAVTKAIQGQNDAWENLQKKSYDEWYAKSTKDKPWGKTALDRAKEYIEETEVSAEWFNRATQDFVKTDDRAFDALIKANERLAKKHQGTIELIPGGYGGFKFSGTRANLIADGEFDSIQKSFIDEYTKSLEDAGLTANQIRPYIDSVRTSLIQTKSAIAGEDYDDQLKLRQTELDGYVKYYSEYTEQYKNLTQQKHLYDEAIYGGNEDSIANAKTQLKKVYDEVMQDTEGNEAIQRFFKTLFPDMSSLIKEWGFSDALDAKNLTQGLKKLKSSDLFNQLFDGDISSEFQSIINTAYDLGIISDTTSESISSLIGKLVKMGLLVEDTAPSLQKYAENILRYQKQLQDVTSAEETFSKALDEQKRQGVVSADTLSDLVEINSKYADCLEDVNGSLVLNADKFREVNQQVLESSRVQTDATLAQAIWQRALGGSNDELDEQINQLLLLSEQYDYATGKLKAWRDAQNNPDKGDLYSEGENAFEALANGIKDGDVGTNQFNSASALLIPQDVLDQGLDSVEEYMANLRYYFADENKAIELGWNQLVEKGLATYDELNGYQLKPDVDKEDIEESLHMTEDMVQMWIDLNEKKGAKFDFRDESILEAKDAVIGLLDAKKELATPTNTGMAPSQEELDKLNEASDRVNKYINFLKELPESVLTKLNLQVNEDGELALLDDPTKVITLESDIEPLRKNFGIVLDEEDNLEDGTPVITPEVITTPALVGLGVIETALSSLTGNTRYVDVVIRQREEKIFAPDLRYPISNGAGGASGLGGNSFASGGISTTQAAKKALVGEEAPEMHVSRQGGKWQLVGQNGAEFIDVQPGDIIFNAQQTKYLLTHGFTNSRGRALINGTSGDAFMSGGINPHTPIYDWSDWKNKLPYNNSSSGSGNGNGYSSAKSDTEEYISTLWQLYEVEKKLQDIQDNKDLLETQLDATDNLIEQIKLREKLIDIYKQEQAAQHNLNEARRALIVDKISELQKQGFDISYDVKNNELFIRNTEHINDLIGATTEETNDLRKEAEEAIETIHDWNDANIEGSQAWIELKKAQQEAKAEIVDTSLKIYDDLIDYYDAFDLWASSGTTKVKVLSDRLKDLNRLYKEGYLSAEQYRENWLDTASDLYDEQKDSLEEIIDLTKKMVKQEVDNQIKALEKLKDEYAEIIRLKKEALETNKDEDDHQQELDEKLAEMAKKKARIDKLALAANSGDKNAAAEKAALDEEYAKLQKELVDFQSDYAYDKQMEALDKEKEAYDDQKDKEIKKLQESIDTEAELYQVAIDRINSGWDTLYEDLMAWNSEYGDGISGEEGIDSAWGNAKEAMNSYYDDLTHRANILGAMNGIKTDTAPGQAGGFTNNTKGTASVSDKVAQMKANSSEWATSKSKERKDQLSAENNRLASEIEKEIEKTTGRKLVRGADGHWYLDRVGGQKLYDVYHDGGEVGSTFNKKGNEIFALLEKGELVTRKEDKGKVLDALEFTRSIGDKLSSLPQTLPTAPPLSSVLGDLATTPSNLTFDIKIDCEGAMTEDAARNAGRRVADTAIEIMNGAFSHMGKYKGETLPV